jgi:hypothetical protein
MVSLGLGCDALCVVEFNIEEVEVVMDMLGDAVVVGGIGRWGGVRCYSHG